MSTFLGIVEEIPGISVDRFDDRNLQSSAFFLSHCHTDHMQGLDQCFFNHLRDSKQFIYCTQLSKLFLEDKFSLDKSQSESIKIVVPCSPIIVDYVFNGKQECITVVSINAGHCPGSVMFIFERENVSILYTGDFRINPNDLPRLKPLHDQAGMTMLPRKFDKIYLDTTFLLPDFKDFPSRQDSLSEVTRATRVWIDRDPENIVILECSANYGPEFLFMELADSLKKRVHVKPDLYQNLSRILELDRCITNDGCSTPIHACMRKGEKYLRCRNVKSKNILTVVPSAMRWAGRELSAKISEWDSCEDRRFYVCLSMHSSYNELKAFIEYFNSAGEFFACVQKPEGIKDRLDELTRKAVKNEYSESKTYKLDSLDSLKITRLERPRAESQYFSDDSSD